MSVIASKRQACAVQPCHFNYGTSIFGAREVEGEAKLSWSATQTHNMVDLRLVNFDLQHKASSFMGLYLLSNNHLSICLFDSDHIEKQESVGSSLSANTSASYPEYVSTGDKIS
ncbi:hypothetical protein CBOM_06704 [Ceraceosorus bombacis]|uniref:Uncharacterized protein n=1 Tax=Ceraceosorus bombacis TaxID=401625 RepID=A0A0P1BR24_9BASI|nr:hypothetical protein CBOM_06704 [Ceraceosorus bombacis]